MIINARDTASPIPVAEVQEWVALSTVVIKIGSFLITLIVYDAGKLLPAFVPSELYTDILSIVITFDKEVG